MSYRIVAGLVNALVVLILAAAVSYSQTCAGAGCLDPSFGLGGTFVTNPPANDTASPGGFTRDMVFQSDGKIVVLVEARDTANTYSAALIRTDKDGNLDQLFGNGGYAYVSWGSPSECLPLRLGIQTINGEERFVVSGISVCGTNRVRVQRYTSSGALDSSFGNNGVVATSAAASTTMAMAILPDQKILIASGTNPMLRLNANGSPDTSFGSNGISRSNTGISISALKILTSGKIVASGYVQGKRSNDFGIARYGSDGKLDTTFGSRGTVAVDFAGKNDLAGDLAIAADGKIIVSGEAIFTDATPMARGYDAEIVRLNANGSLDTSFGTGGKSAPLDIGGLQDFFGSVSIQSDGKIVLTGESRLAGNTGNADVLVARYNSNGTLDMSFNGTGWSLTDFYGAYDQGTKGLIQYDSTCLCEKFVVAGTVSRAQSSTSPRDTVFLRFLL